MHTFPDAATVVIQDVTEIMTAAVALRLPQEILPDPDNELVDGVRARTDTLRASGYARGLRDSLLLRKDLILDFTSLKACLDPLSESQQESEDGKTAKQLQFNYEGFLYEWFEEGERLPPLKSLAVRNLKLSTDGPDIDNYAYFCHGLMQMTTLVELDLSGNQIPQSLQQHLQFWNVYNLKKLAMDSTGLSAFPPSVGRLRKLETLTLSKNNLSDLPVTLSFCENLKVLNLKGNGFNRIPGVVLRLKKLEDFRRIDNPLPLRWNGFASPPHVTSSYSNPDPNKKSKAQNSKTKDGVQVAYNPDGLQMLCTKAVFTYQLDYWKLDMLGPLQCKILDSLASQFVICENCHTAIPKQGYTVDVLLLSFLGLRDVPFRLHACSETCQSELKQKFQRIQEELQRKLDREYEETIRQAEALVSRNGVDISTGAVKAPVDGSDYSRRRRRKKCVVM